MDEELPPIHSEGGPNAEVLWPETISSLRRISWPRWLPVLHISHHLF